MNIYFSGIGGVGIGPLAEIAFDAGYRVQGSEMQETPLTHDLRSRGVLIEIDQDGEYLQACHDQQPIDWFVYTSALPASHPELLLAHSLGIKVAKRDELLARIIEEKGLKLIAVAGTHGKTTTTGMLVWAFKELGIPVSYSVGTTLSFGPSGKFDPASEYFVYECDEFDRNFLHFTPHLSLITSIGYDHSDTYPTKDAYVHAFHQFADQSQAVIMWQADNQHSNIDSSNNWLLQANDLIKTHLPGEHNRKNATLVLKALEYLHLATPDSAIAILNRFPGTDRRFEKLGDNLYSDYGHHPTEIAATVQLAREIADHIVLVYQPHQNVRQHEIRDQYRDCFTLADTVYWLPTYLSREDPSLAILTPEDLASVVVNKNAIHIADFNNELWDHIKQARSEGRLVLAMGAGSIDDWLRQKLASDQSQ